MEFKNVFEMYADIIANYCWNPLHCLLDFWSYTLLLFIHRFDTRISFFRHLVLKNKGQASLPNYVTRNIFKIVQYYEIQLLELQASLSYTCKMNSNASFLNMSYQKLRSNPPIRLVYSIKYDTYYSTYVIRTQYYQLNCFIICH